MPEVNITINNREHKIACSPGEEQRVKELASLLNNEVVKIANNLGQIGDVKLMVLAAITILDKNQDIIDDATKNIDNNKKIIEKIFNKLEKNT
jgi:cell division protein ZapA